MIERGAKVKATPQQQAVINRWKQKLGKRGFIELLQKLQPAMAQMDAERERDQLQGFRQNTDRRIVRVMPDQQCIDFYSELVEARKRDREQ